MDPPLRTLTFTEYLYSIAQFGLSLQFNPEVFTKLIAEMTPNRLIKQRMFINPWWPTCVILYFLLPEFLIGGFGMIFVDPEDKEMIPIGILCLVVFAIFGIAWPCYCIFASWKVTFFNEHHKKRTFLSTLIITLYLAEVMHLFS